MKNGGQAIVTGRIGVIGDVRKPADRRGTNRASPECPRKQTHAVSSDAPRHQRAEVPEPKGQHRHECHPIEIVGQQRDIGRQDDDRQHETGSQR